MNNLQKIRNKIDEIRKNLIEIIHDSIRAQKVAPIDLYEIREYIELNKDPQKPASTPLLMKEFMSSCCSYSKLGKWLSSHIGEKAVASTIHKSLATIYNEKAFANEENWYPEILHRIAKKIRIKRGYTFPPQSPPFDERVIGVLLTGSEKMMVELKDGLETFYARLAEVNRQPFDMLWKFAEDFTNHPVKIYQVNAALISDFFKNIGCTRFVKVDYHVEKEFPDLIDLNCKKMNKKEVFRRSIELAELLGLTPFYLDKLLYQWGQYKHLKR